MAELIDRNSLLANLNKFAPEHFNALVNDLIKKEPVATTETEIRAKAISDFLQFVYDNASNEEYANEDGWAFSDLMDLEYKFAEQLKERSK